ncbi:hypothetical protein QTO34_018430 [Cnephaeus nilssonii]|uniref:RNase H type-1 domain-containing protein n=1 Tax=Cnephaeus nilssonii TaxID=3371016 RepID=A0AA40LQ65_CNENI|nr:hypothetical protein QTO34_018430 [Eptesicus nilssonii]
MVDLLETIFQTQKPSWVDCKQLLFTFFNTEEHMRVMTEAQKWLQTQAPAGISDTDRWVREAFTDAEPDWNPNSEDGRARLERFRLAFLQGVRAGAKKPTNMAKISEVFQKPDESPAAFYEKLCEAYQIYTPFNPEALENHTMEKVQKLEGLAGKNATELLEIANKVFINRDNLAKPLYEALKGEEKAPINWGPEQEKAFISLKAKLNEASALGLPDVTRDFNLFVHENSGEEKESKNQNEILKLLEAVWEPKEIAVIHCKGHQKGKDSVSEGNQCADATAKLAAKEQVVLAWIMLAPELPEPPKYTPQEEEWVQQEGGKRTKEGWWILPDHRVYVPEQLAHKVVLQQHELTNLGKTALEALLGRYYLIACLPSLCASVSQCCLLCAQNNAKQGTAVHPYKPGDQVWVKDWKKEPLLPTWKGPYPVILTSPTALKVAGLNTWIHHSRVKAAHQPSDAQPEWKVTSDQKHPLRITLKKTSDLADQPAPRNLETLEPPSRLPMLPRADGVVRNACIVTMAMTQVSRPAPSHLSLGHAVGPKVKSPPT